MNIRIRTLLAFSTFLAGMLGSHAVANGAASEEASTEVLIGKSSCGSECVMVFARVGERFEYAFEADSNSATFTTGANAAGETSKPPVGLRFDPASHELTGIPQRPGFHEFVVLQTQEGVTQEKVVLIDVQGYSIGAGGIDYASYFAGGVR